MITYNIKMTAQSEDYFETQTKSCSYFLPPLIHLSRVCVDSGNEKLYLNIISIIEHVCRSLSEISDTPKFLNISYKKYHQDIINQDKI